MNVIEDQARFTYYVNEESIGFSESTWAATGEFRNRGSFTLAGKTFEVSLDIVVDATGHWVQASLKTMRGPAQVQRTGAEVVIKFLGKEECLRLKPGTLLIEDGSPALLSQAIFAYDHEKSGRQTFPLLFLPYMITEGSLEYLDSFERRVNGRLQRFRRYEYGMPPIYHAVVTVDDQNRVCVAEYPQQHGVFVRDGWEALQRQSGPSDALLSQPKHQILAETNQFVPMRDGITLATDIYRPVEPGRWPVVLVRTPYKKELLEWQARFFARRGYVFAAQDVRGRFGSHGRWKPFRHESQDGYDTIEWLADQPWSSGKIGLIGGSYLGWVQWWAASKHPPHLATMIPNVSPPEPGYNFPHQYGALMLAPSLWWSHVVEQEVTAELSGLAFQESLGLMDADKLKHLPVIELDERVLGKKIDVWREWLQHPGLDQFWQDLAFIDRFPIDDVPVFHQSGWFDGNGLGAKLNYLGLAARGHQSQKLVIGPWGHTDADGRYGPQGRDWGRQAVVDLQTSYLRWMDRWLKGIANGIDREPAVSLFILGANDWIHGDSYPLAATCWTKYYFASGQNAVPAPHSGSLTTSPETSDVQSSDAYRYDPVDPTPVNPEGRDDLLVYETPPLTEPLTIAGPISAVLYASTSAKDTDWVVRLAKKDLDGRPSLITQGILRARYRESLSEPTLLEPDKVYRYEIDVGHAGIRLANGEQLLVTVSSALFPIFSRNLNTGENNETSAEHVAAQQRVYHDSTYPSHVLIPVISQPGQEQ